MRLADDAQTVRFQKVGQLVNGLLHALAVIRIADGQAVTGPLHDLVAGANLALAADGVL